MTDERLPETDYSPLLRTGFTDDDAWQALLDEIVDEWMTVLPDSGHRGLSVQELVALVPDGSCYPVLIVADDATFSSTERSLLLIDVDEEPGRTFRAVPDAVQSVNSNLSIQNQSFGDYLDSLGDSGIYRVSDKQRQALAALQGFIQPGTNNRYASIPGYTPDASAPRLGVSRANLERPAQP
ncbi:hypothetical protein ABZ252_24495 [Streptomyces sp. NPDC006175]|uniref:DUF6924 domain-containing protein n=1 Tax=unclassified Streptomyces TaxID=2593676 RepID=UPI0033BDCAA3